MHHVIYFNQKPLLVTDSKSGMAEALLTQSAVLYEDQLNNNALDNLLSGMQEQNINGGVFLHSDIAAVLEAFKKKLKVIVAGGGLVHTETGRVLLIFRKGKWDLPKGKLDDGETVAAAALREVREETGLSQLQLQMPLTVTHHTYYEGNTLILKESHWFLMKSNAKEPLIPQEEEDIEKCEWVRLDSVESYFSNSHPSIVDVLKLGIQKLQAASNQ